MILKSAWLEKRSALRYNHSDGQKRFNIGTRIEARYKQKSKTVKTERIKKHIDADILLKKERVNMSGKETFGVELAKLVLRLDAIGSYQKSDPIYHYTSPQGLLGILQPDNPVLWFSRYDALNDKTEGMHIFEVYGRVCDDLLRREQISKPFYESIRHLRYPVKEAFVYGAITKHSSYIKSDEYDRYICCFSKARDSLSMWNYYTKDGKYEGYNIGFSFFETQHVGVQNPFETNCHFNLCNVIYEDVKKERIIQDEIISCFSIIDDFDSQIQSIQYHIMQFLKAVGLIFKSSCFKHEEEVRAIFTVPKSNQKFEVKYREKNGYIIPYIALAFQKDNVREITIGPLLNDDIAQSNLMRMTRAYQYPVRDFQTSEALIRY